MNTNPTKYKMYINYDNDKKVYVVPVLPEKISVTVKGKTASMDVDRFGEVVHKGKRDAITISFQSYFPRRYGRNYCSCMEKEFKSPKVWNKWLISLESASKPCHFVLTGGPLALNLYADVISYSAYEEGGDVGTIYYKIELKEHRKPVLSTYKKKTASKKKAKKKASGKRTNNKSTPKTYTVVKGDCLSLIAQKIKKQYGISTSSAELYSKNKNVIENTAKKYGRSSSNNGWWIYPGTKLAIP